MFPLDDLLRTMVKNGASDRSNVTSTCAAAVTDDYRQAENIDARQTASQCSHSGAADVRDGYVTHSQRAAVVQCCVDSVLDEVACRICCQLGCMESCLLRQYLEGESLQQRRVFRKARGRGGGGAQWGAGGRKSQAGKGLASIVTSPASNAEPNVRQQKHAH